VAAWVLAAGLGCGAEPAPGESTAHPKPGDHALPLDELGSVAGEVSCPATLEAYPVAGPHNGGYDKNALTYSCAPHPQGSPDNSDFIAGDHYGNDIFGAKGTLIVAPRSGIVVKAGYINVGGNRVTIQDACGWQYYHAHLDTIHPSVHVGKTVKAGDPIGTLGDTGNAAGTSPHLHFSIYPDGDYEQGIDPFPLLQAVDASACKGGVCDAHCEGTVIIGADCSAGDCGAFGATCIYKAGKPECGQPCAPKCNGAQIVAADCSVGDCGAFGATCVVKGGVPQCALSCAPHCEGTKAVAADC
jgi:hypothetical protein